MSARAAAGRRWSATSSVQYRGPGNDVLSGQEPPAAVKALVRWRLDGRNCSATLTGPALHASVRTLRALLAAAYESDWDADPRTHRPVPAPSTRLDTVSPAPALQPAFRTASEEAAPDPGQLVDVDALADWYLARCQSMISTRRRAARSDKTLAGYASVCRTIKQFAVYPAGDPRAVRQGLPPGASLRLDDPATGVSETDLVQLLDRRQVTNLRTRQANDRRMNKWADRVATLGAAAGPPPSLRPEVAQARTIAEFSMHLKSMFTMARLHQKIGFQPWTAAVNDQIAGVWSSP